jgi:hypothetical protein
MPNRPGPVAASPAATQSSHQHNVARIFNVAPIFNRRHRLLLVHAVSGQVTAALSAYNRLKCGHSLRPDQSVKFGMPHSHFGLRQNISFTGREACPASSNDATAIVDCCNPGRRHPGISAFLVSTRVLRQYGLLPGCLRPVSGNGFRLALCPDWHAVQPSASATELGPPLPRV